MLFETDPSLGGPAGTAIVPGRPWLLAATDPLASGRLASALSRFGVDARPSSQSPATARHSPVLCDARQRDATQAWLGEMPWRTAPMLFFGVSAAGARARLIHCGADDVVSATVAPAELAARMQAALRSHSAAQGHIALAGFEFDTGLRQVRWAGVPMPLMPREFDLLLVLARQAGMAVSRDALLRAVWRTEFDPGTNSLEVHICKLRRNLASLGETVRIETLRNRGYRLVIERDLKASSRGG